MIFWIILIAAALIGFVWWQIRANYNHGSDRTNNEDNVHYHQTHLATEASEELTPEMPSVRINESDVYYYQNHLASESSQQNQNQTSQALTLYDPSSVNNNQNEGVYYHQTHLAAEMTQTASPTGEIPSSEEGIQQVHQQNQEQNK